MEISYHCQQYNVSIQH